MKFFRIKTKVGDTFHPETTYHPQDLIGAESKETALALCKQDWENDGYTVLEVISCEEIYPEAVFCNHIIKQGEVEKWLRR